MKTEEIYSDLPFNMKLNQNNDITPAKNALALNQSILNILCCSKNTRFLNPDFGCNLLKFLFEEFSEETAYKIGTEIKNKLEMYEPRISILGIKINMSELDTSYEIEIDYYIKEIQLPSKVTFTLTHL